MNLGIVRKVDNMTKKDINSFLALLIPSIKFKQEYKVAGT